MLIDFLNEQNIPHRIEGKIVVDHNVDKISNLLSRSEALNMSGVKVLEKNDIQKIEPYCKFDNASSKRPPIDSKSRFYPIACLSPL